MKNNPFALYRGAILPAAAEIYRSEKTGIEPDPVRSRVTILPKNHGNFSRRDLKNALIIEAEVNVAARAVSQLAILKDQVDTGGLFGRLARIEIRLRRIFERAYTKHALKEPSLVDAVRAASPRNSQRPHGWLKRLIGIRA